MTKPSENRYEMVVGLETHVELKTRTKAFCGCENRYGAPPNTLVCPVCLGLPGTLPVLNRRAMELAALAGFALNCRVNPVSSFDRKNFFYPDLPKAYQITQFFHPLCEAGFVEIPVKEGVKRIGITRIHVEEDAGKLLHDRPGVTAIDLNRCGVPLIEIVTEPDFRAPEEASAYLKKLRAILSAAGVSDCRMNEGSLRCDVNLSLRRPGEPMGTRTEMKNLNSFQSVERAIRAEYARQAAILDAGGTVLQETLRFDQRTGKTIVMRRKESTGDYRYFPEPDLPPVAFSAEELERLRASLPMLPDEKCALFQQKYGLSRKAAELLTEETWLAAYYEQAAVHARSCTALANLLLGEVFAQLTLREPPGTERNEASLPIPPDRLAALSNLLSEGRVNSSTGKKILAVLFDEDVEPEAYAREHGLFLLTDESVLRQAAAQALQENPALTEGYLRGKLTVEKALMGKAMALTGGRADPEVLSRLVHEVLTALAASQK